MTHTPTPSTHTEFAGISKTYPSGVQALQDIDLTVHQGEVFGIIGRNGAGKPILPRLFSRLENANSGEMFIHSKSTVRYSTRQLRDLRRQVAMTFQHFNLMTTKTVTQNVALPLKVAGVPTDEHQRRASEMLKLVGLSTLRDSYLARLSGDQKQRAGIARALAAQPEVLLYDEVTSAPDPEDTLLVLTLLKEINQRLGLAIVLITHGMEVIRTLCDRVSMLEDGRIVEQGGVWRVFGNPQHPMTRAILDPQHPDRPEVGPPLHDGEQIVTLRFDGNSGCEPNLQHIASLLGSGTRLLYSNCERIQGQVIDQLQVRLSGPLAASALAQGGWVANGILTHHHQTAETAISQPSNGIIFPILC